MSDYERNKVIRIPAEKIIPRTDGESNSNYRDRVRDFLEKTLPKEITDFTSIPRFELAPTICTFIDYVIFSSYSEESSDFGFSNYLTDENFEKYVPIFRQLNLPFNQHDLRKVDYCYYNGCEADDCYEVIDDF